MSKKKLLLSIEDLKALGIIKRKKKKRKGKKNKKMYDSNNIYGIKSDSSHLINGFGSQINTSNDLQNELIRTQMKAIQDDQKLKIQTHQMAIEENRFNRIEYFPRIDELNRRHQQLVDNSTRVVRDIYNKISRDNIDVAKTGGSEFFNTEGKPVPENDNINQNIADYLEKVEYNTPPIKQKMSKAESLKNARLARAEKTLLRKETKAKAKAKTKEIEDLEKEIRDAEAKEKEIKDLEKEIRDAEQEIRDAQVDNALNAKFL